MEETLPNLVGIKDAAEIVGCSDKVIRNYIRDGKISFHTSESPYGDQYMVNPDEVSQVYNSRRSSTLELKKSSPAMANSTPEVGGVKELLPVLERFQSDYKDAMETVSRMSYELGNAQKEVKLLTGDSLERSAMERQIQELIKTNAVLETKVSNLQERLEELQALKDARLEQLQKEKESLEQALEKERSKGLWERIKG